MKSPKSKSIYLLLNILLLVLTFLLIPLNILVVNFPRWLVIFFSGISVTGIVVYGRLFRTKPISKIIFITVFLAITVFTSLFTYCCPYWNSYVFKNYSGTQLNYNDEISYQQAKEDLKAAVGYLEAIHPMFQNGLTDQIAERYHASLQKLQKMQTITVNDLRREIQTIINPLHDAHTTTYNNCPGDRYLKDTLQKRADGYTIYSVNGFTTEEITEAARPYFSYESEELVFVDCGSLAALTFYGYTAPYTFVWQDENENKITETSFVSYEIDEEHSLALLTLTQCIYNKEYINCVNTMFTEVKAKNIQNVAIDVRNNGGGNSMVANELVKYLPVDSFVDCPSDWRWGAWSFSDDGRRRNRQYTNLIFEGNVYVLTNSRSFSSAMDLAQIIQDNGLGKIIGGTPANSTNSYGDVTVFCLPHTGLMMQISTKKWYRIDADNMEDYVIPDYPCDSNDAASTLYSLLQ